MKYLVLFCLIVLTASGLQAQNIAFTQAVPTYTTNANAYQGSAATLPAGWSCSTANYRGVNNGSLNSGGAYGYGSSAAETAFGSLYSGTNGEVSYTVSFVNNTGTTITGLNITYDAEQWRFANTSGIIASQSGMGSANVSTLSHNGVASGTAPLVTAKSANLTSLNIANNATFSLTWITNGAASSGSDNGIGIDNFSITATFTVLPLNWLSFDAAPQGDKVELKWKTANEVAVSHFEIESGKDGRYFKSIGTLPAQNREENAYTYEDDRTQSRNSGDTYYRLRQVDFDGKFSYSKTLIVEGAGKVTSVYPNPVSSQLNVDRTIEEDTPFSVLNIQGQVILQGVLEAGSKNEAQAIDTRELQSGVYFLQFGTEQPIRFVKE